MLDLLKQIVMGKHETICRRAPVVRRQGPDRVTDRRYSQAARITLLAEISEIKAIVDPKKAKQAAQ